jgi:hypothetical protein
MQDKLTAAEKKRVHDTLKLIKAHPRYVTRDDAQEWLLHIDETMQRARNPNLVERYAADMDAGNWQPGTALIARNGKGNLDNGQHVLAGLLRSRAKGVIVIYSENRVKGAYAGFDHNRKRTIKDDLKTLGVERPGDIGSMIIPIWQYEQGIFAGLNYMGKRSGSHFPTPAQGCEAVKMHPGMHEHLHKNPFPGKEYQLSVMRAASYILHQLDRERAHAFFDSLVNQVRIPTTKHPIWVLSKAIKDLNKGERWRNGDAMARIFKAWNAYYLDQPIAGPLLKKNEPFPEPLGPDSTIPRGTDSDAPVQ